MRLSKRNIKKWADALRSGEYEQGLYTLQGVDGFCCLGVACDIFSPDHPRNSRGYLKHYAPNVDFGDPLWLQMLDRDFSQKTGEHIVTLNDVTNFTFQEIADLLEAVYIYEVLK